MDYKYSQVDKSNLAWFQNDNSRQLLRGIWLQQGEVRGLAGVNVEFNYPIAAVAGRNGSGKTTLLALASCAFHNSEDGFRLSDRAVAYYRFSDFFFQTADEVPPEGIAIYYRIAYDNWADMEPGLGWQVRQKAKGGKWNDYGLRIYRDVVFFGIERVVPPAEKSVFRSYRLKFADISATEWQELVRKSVSYVLGLPYQEIRFKGHGKYRLPVVRTGGHLYSGFNMGAGEKALFEIFSAVYAAPAGTLFVIDEIELGLHELAQRRLIDHLKLICRDRKIQVICTTHSHAILRSLPPEGRLYLERSGALTRVIGGITPDFALGRMSGENSRELDIYVEDGFARTLVSASLPFEVRSRVLVHAIGNPDAIGDQCLARYRHRTSSEVLAVVDGDQSTKLGSIKARAASKVSAQKKSEFETWLSARLTSLPGKEPPEKWVLQTALNADIHGLSNQFVCEPDFLFSALNGVIDLPDAHDIMPALAETLHLPQEQVEQVMCRVASLQAPDEFQVIYDHFTQLLG